jgi:hypothetical protein
MPTIIGSPPRPRPSSVSVRTRPHSGQCRIDSPGERDVGACPINVRCMDGKRVLPFPKPGQADRGTAGSESAAVELACQPTKGIRGTQAAPKSIGHRFASRLEHPSRSRPGSRPVEWRTTLVASCPPEPHAAWAMAITSLCTPAGPAGGSVRLLDAPTRRARAQPPTASSATHGPRDPNHGYRTRPLGRYLTHGLAREALAQHLGVALHAQTAPTQRHRLCLSPPCTGSLDAPPSLRHSADTRHDNTKRGPPQPHRLDIESQTATGEVR